MPEIEGETPDEQLPEDHPVLKALRAEREARKQAEARIEAVQREAETFSELKSRFPFLEKEDIKVLYIEEWEAYAERLDKLRGTSTSEKAPEEAPVDPPEVSQLAKAQELGAGTPAGETKTYTPDEVGQIGLKDQAAALRIIAEGRMQTPSP